MPLSYIPAYSVGPGIGLVVNLLLVVGCLALAAHFRTFPALRSLAVLYLAQSVFFLGYFIYGYQLSSNSILFWYAVMMAGLVWMPFTLTWVASDLGGENMAWLKRATLAAALAGCAALAFSGHPWLLSLPLEPMPQAPVWRPQSLILRPAIYLYTVGSAGLIIYLMAFRWWQRSDIPPHAGPMTLGLSLMLTAGMHDALYAMGWAVPLQTTVLWAGSVAMSLCQAAAVALRYRDLSRDLTTSQQKYRAVLEGIEEGFYEVDLKGDFTFFNPAMSRIIGYPPGELMGMNNRRYMTEEGARQVFNTFNQVYLSGKPAQAVDWELVRKDGSRAIIEVSIAPIAESDEGVTGFRGIARDVTRRRQAEEELAKRRNQLQRLAAELVRTEDRERRNLATRLHDGVGQYLAVARLRLTALEGKLAGREADSLQVAVDLLRQAIEESRSLTGRLFPTILHREGLHAALGWLAQDAAGRHNLAVDYQGEPDQGLSEDLRNFLYRAAAELLHNVVKHAQARRVEVNFQCRDGHAVLTVADDGRGITEANLNRKDRGLGLFSIMERADFWGGSLRLGPAPAGGAQARLELPLEASATRGEAHGPDNADTAG